MSGTVNNSQNLYFDFQGDQLERRIATLEKDNAALLAELARLRAKAEERRKVIEPLEWLWSDRTQQYYCPHCLKHKMPGHASDCALAKALREE